MVKLVKDLESKLNDAQKSLGIVMEQAINDEMKATKFDREDFIEKLKSEIVEEVMNSIENINSVTLDDPDDFRLAFDEYDNKMSIESVEVELGELISDNLSLDEESIANLIASALESVFPIVKEEVDEEVDEEVEEVEEVDEGMKDDACRKWARDNYEVGTDIPLHYGEVVQSECRIMNSETE
tara:strand:- start:2491 stop:3039 length:549 start_codon:yes stop_codon:yes gene_type:complete